MKTSALIAFVLAGGASVGMVVWANTPTNYEIAQSLASQDIIVTRDTEAEYRLTNFVLRQEVIGTALRIANVDLVDEYPCKGYFVDADFNVGHPDHWVCRSVELATDRGIISRRLEMVVDQRRTRPRDLITRSEALAILMQATNAYPVSEFTGYRNHWSGNIFEDKPSLGYEQAYEFGASWQAEVWYAYGRIILDDITFLRTDPRANQYATRAEIFRLAHQILEKQSAITCVGLQEDVGVGIGSECCSGLTKIRHKDDFVNTCTPEEGVDTPIFCITPIAPPMERFTCANVGDNICDKNFENLHNSSDCKQPINTYACQRYFDGCNWCFQSDFGGPAACTLRACFGAEEPSPYCETCLEGFVLEGGECVPATCIGIGGNAGNFGVQYDTFAYQCCADLTKTNPKDQIDSLLGGRATCVDIGDDFCDFRHESIFNSSNCVFETSGCSEYVDMRSDCRRCSEENGETTCISIPCEPSNATQYCTGCDSGYELLYGQCHPIATDPITENIQYDLRVCTGYYDGCNQCSVSGGEIHACTEIFCMTPERPHCTEFLGFTSQDVTLDTAGINARERNIQIYADDLRCEHNDDCALEKFAHQPCLGQDRFVLYSKRAIIKNSLLLQMRGFNTIFQDYLDTHDMNGSYNCPGRSIDANLTTVCDEESKLCVLKE